MKKHDITIREMFDLIEPDVEDIPETEFDVVYDQLVAVLRKIGSYSDGATEPADFSSSRWVDPANQILVEVDPSSVHLVAEAVAAVEQELATSRRFTIGFMARDHSACVIKEGNSQP